MIASITFRECVAETLRSALIGRGYQLRKEIADLSPPEVPDDFYLPFTKTLNESSYAHIVLSHSFFSKEQEQELTVILLRYDGIEPWMSMATPIPGRSHSNIAGYLPGPERAALPLIREQHNARRQWRFQDNSELSAKLLLVRSRLTDTVLYWLESPTSTQFIHTEKEWYIEPFEKYVAREWSASESYEKIRHFELPGYWIDTGDIEETHLVNEVTRILFQLQLPEPINRPNQQLLEYLVACLRSQHQFNVKRYREIRSSLSKVKRMIQE